MDKDEPQRGFTGWWIPVELGADKRLNWTDRALIAEIYALAHGPRGCIASNAHFARHLGVSQQRVIDIMTKLRRYGYVKTVTFDGRNRKLVARMDLWMEWPPASGQTTFFQVGSPRENAVVEIESKNKDIKRRFQRPALSELKAYANSIGYATFDPQAFLDHYEAVGWMVGKHQMKSWEASVRNWRAREKDFAPKKPAMSYKTRETRINQLNERKRDLIRDNAPYWKIHEIDMQLRDL